MKSPGSLFQQVTFYILFKFGHHLSWNHSLSNVPCDPSISFTHQKHQGKSFFWLLSSSTCDSIWISSIALIPITWEMLIDFFGNSFHRGVNFFPHFLTYWYSNCLEISMQVKNLHSAKGTLTASLMKHFKRLYRWFTNLHAKIWWRDIVQIYHWDRRKLIHVLKFQLLKQH